MSIEPEALDVASHPDKLLTRTELAAALQVLLRTVDCMLADGEITPVRLRKTVRFSLPDVLHELREKAKTSKRNVARRV
jgi:excisionase family DNA binding protein